MKLFGRQLGGFAKVLISLIVMFALAGSLYGIDMAILKHADLPGNEGTPFVLLGIATLAVTLVAAGLIVLVLLAWGVRGLFVRLTRHQS